jgi:carbonic anhydrase/acetyltransferase-like protein (isoleucine patch superfamily)
VPIFALGDRIPSIDPSAFVHPDAVVIGNVTIGPESTVWPGAVLRGDYGEIFVGARTSVQDGTVVHATDDHPTRIGDLEGCTVENGSLVGSGSVILHRAVIRSGALVGAGAVVPNDTDVPSGAMALGVPVKIREGVVPPGAFTENVALYVANGKRYREELRRID